MSFDYYGGYVPGDPGAPVPSDTHVWRTTGISPQFIPGRVDRRATSPACSEIGAAEHNDYFRDSLDQYCQDGELDVETMPSATPFRRDNERYKGLDIQAQNRDKEVKKYNKTAKTKVARKASKAGDSGTLYGGEPFESQEWHMGAKDVHRNAGEAWQTAKKGRDDMSDKYIGYDSFKGYQGHKQRSKNCERSGNSHMGDAERHGNYEFK